MALHPADFTSIDLCAGAHGLGLGLGIAVPLAFPGFRARSVCHVEREAFAAATLVGHMEAGTLDPAPVWSDLATFDGRPWRGRVHCVTSGDPCQPNSVAGKRLGADDDRFLADQVVRVVDEVRPLCVFRENVPGNADGQLGVLVPALEGLGYRVECGIFSSAETGNSHGRRRLIMLAYADGWQSWDGHIQRGGQFGFLAKGDRSGGRDAGMGDAQLPQWRPHFGRSEDRGADSAAPGRIQGSGGAGASGAGMVDTARIGRREGRAEHAREQGRSAVAGSGGELADAGAARLQGRELCGACHDERHGGDAPQSVAEFCRAHLHADPVIIPGPSDPRWPALLAEHPELAPAIDAAEAERLLCRGFDALANRVDRLRLLGNGCDPVTIAYSFLCLLERSRCRNH